MKILRNAFVITVLLVLSSCRATRNITESYIKNNVEQHREGEFSSIKTLSLFKGITYKGDAYLELTGYKYAGKKALIIGADKYYNARKKFIGDETMIAKIMYIELSVEQCEAIIMHYKTLRENLRSDKPVFTEEVYHDYTVSKDLFISFRRTKTSASTGVGYMNLWIRGEKFSMAPNTLIYKLEKFLKY